MTNAQIYCYCLALQRLSFSRSFSLILAHSRSSIFKKATAVGPASGMGVHSQHSAPTDPHQWQSGQLRHTLRPRSAPKLDRHRASAAANNQTTSNPSTQWKQKLLGTNEIKDNHKVSQQPLTTVSLASWQDKPTQWSSTVPWPIPTILNLHYPPAPQTSLFADGIPPW